MLCLRITEFVSVGIVSRSPLINLENSRSDSVTGILMMNCETSIVMFAPFQHYAKRLINSRVTKRHIDATGFANEFRLVIKL